MSKFTVTRADKKVSNWVAGVILEGAGTLPQLPFGPHGLAPRDLSAVAQGIREEKILVYFHDNAKMDPLALKTGGIVLQKKVSHGGLTLYKGVVVHEAVHVAFDLQGSQHPFVMSGVEDETAAFMAEAIYLRRQGVLASTIAGDKFLSAAYHAAGTVLGGENTGRALDQLRQVVLEKYGGEQRIKNGLGR